MTGSPRRSAGHQGVGEPIGASCFLEGFLHKRVTEHQTLLDRIPLLPDLQSAWSLLLHCASAKANYLLRVVEPDAVAEFARAHDQGIWKCLCELLHVDPVQREETTLSASLPLSLGGLGLRSAARTSVSAFWASWADTLPMIHARHREIANHFVGELEGVPEGPSLGAAARAMRSLAGTMGFEPPSWEALA